MTTADERMRRPRAGRDRPLQRDPARTQAEILRVATEVFADEGYSGARVDEIAARTRTTKRMIYYYFGGKEGLYMAVLEGVYAAIREREQDLVLDTLPPREAMAEVVRFAFDYHGAHPELCRIVSIENIHKAEHLERSARARTLNWPIITLLETILARGRDQGDFRRDADAMEIHVMIMAMAMYAVNHRATVRAGFGYDMGDPPVRARLRDNAVQAVLAFLTTPEAG